MDEDSIRMPPPATPVRPPPPSSTNSSPTTPPAVPAPLPLFHNPFSTIPGEAPGRLSLADDTYTFNVHHDDGASPRPSLRVKYSASSVASSGKRNSSTPDLLSHGASAFSSSRKNTLHRKSSQAFRRPKPTTMLMSEIPKPWMRYRDPAHRYAKWIFWGCWFAGIAIVIGLCYDAYRSIPTLGNLCVVMEDDFSSGSISRYFWDYQVDVDPGRLGTFQWSSASPNNSFVSDSTLYLVPTLTSDHLGLDAIINGATVNLTSDGSCTNSNVSKCVVTSNSTLGTVINPVQGVIMKSKFSIKYGKVEIMAKLPTGDWIWPSLRLMPVNDTYGMWPRSGEIDILNARGNAPGYGELGSDYMLSALHWGPNKLFDSFYRSWGIRRDKVNGYANGFRKFTLEWSPDFLTTYIDNKVQTSLSLKFDKSFWDLGNYPAFYTDQDGNIARLENPWYSSPNKAAPFDQLFYLEMSLAVGGTAGNYFPDNLGNKPWQDSSPLAMSDFWTARDRWTPTWPKDPKQRGMAVKSVKMWKQC